MKASSLVIETFVVFIIVTCSAYPVITSKQLSTGKKVYH